MRRLYIAVAAILILMTARGDAASSYVAWTKERLIKESGFTSPVISTDGRYAAVCPLAHHNVWFFDTNSAEPLWKFEPATGSVFRDLAISGNGEYLMAAGSDIAIFKKDSNKPLWGTGTGQNMYVNKAAVSADGKYFYAGGGYGGPGFVYLFNKESEKPVKYWEVMTAVDNMAITPDGKYFLIGGKKGLALYDRDGDKSVMEYITQKDTGESDSIVSVDICESGKYFTATTYKGNLLVFEKGKGLLWIYSVAKPTPDLNVSITKDGSQIALVSYNDYRVFSITNSTPIWTSNYPSYFAHVKQSSRGKYIAIADSRGHHVYFFDNDYAKAHEAKPFRVYVATFPSALSISEDADRIIYDEANLQFREVPPGIIIDIQDWFRVYYAGAVIHSHIFVSNPGKKSSLHVQVRLSLITPDMVNDEVDSYKDADKRVVSKLRDEDKITKLGSKEIFKTDVDLDHGASSDLDVEFKVPPMLVPQALQDLFDCWDSVIDYCRKSRKYLYQIFPKDIAKAIDEETFKPLEENAKEMKKQAEEALRKGVEPEGMPGFSVPVLGFGLANLSDKATTEVLDRDTWNCVYMLSAKDVIPKPIPPSKIKESKKKENPSAKINPVKKKKK